MATAKTEAPKITIVNIQTGEITEAILSDEEKAERLASAKLQSEAVLTNEAARESALAKLAALGLTADEIAAL